MPTDAPGLASALSTGLVGPIIPGFFDVDPLSLIVLVCLAALAVLLILCAPATRRFFPRVILLLFFFIGAIGVVTAANVVTFFGGWEFCGLFAWGLGRIAEGDERSGEGIIPLQAAGGLGSFLMVIGLAFVAVNRHSLLLGPAEAGLPPAVPLIVLFAITLKVYGLLAEGWVGRPEHRFTLTGATLVGAGLLSMGMYPFLRFFGPVFGGIASWRGPVFWIAAALAVIMALAALGEVDYRRALSYGAFSQFWLLVLVFSLGSHPAMLGAIVGAVADAFAFTGLFLCLSAAEAATSRVLLHQVGGLAQRMPLTAALFAACSVSVLGLPPLGGFLANGLIGVAAAGSPALPIIWMVVLGLTLAYLARIFCSLFLGEPRGPVHAEHPWAVALLSGGVVGMLVVLGTSALALLAPIARVLPG